MHKQFEPTRRTLCSNLAAKTLTTTPTTYHDKWLHQSGNPVSTPSLPSGNFWSLLNNIKVLHQYTEILSETASNKGPHALALHAHPDACVRGLEWLAPLLTTAIPIEDPTDYHNHVSLWRASNPGLFSNSEAMFHTHQAYVVEDLNMTRLLTTSLIPTARNYDVAIASNLLKTRPDSYDEFHTDLTTWRTKTAYHPLILAALHMPRAEQWLPPQCLHESDDWQSLLDSINQSGFLTHFRLEEILSRLSDRSQLLQNSICGVLDRICTLMDVKSDSPSPTPLSALLPSLQSKPDPQAPYTNSLLAWPTLKASIQNAIPPSLLCPSLSSSNRDGWGYKQLQLQVLSKQLLINPGPLQWIKKGACIPTEPHAGLITDRFQDMLFRMGETATSPEIAHLMLQPESMLECLSEINSAPDFSLINDRNNIIQSMSNPPNHAFLSCVKLLVSKLPPVTPQTFPAPLSVLAWRIDCPQPTILYIGHSDNIDLNSTQPHTLPKLLLYDKMPNRYISGISVLSDTLDTHQSLRAILADEILAGHQDFACHPFLQAQITSRNPPISTPATCTTLAETVAVFTQSKPDNHTEIPLHTSKPWEEDHIDDRYAETQTALNGTRYRDWVTMYRSEQDLFKSRLASHHIQITQLFHTHFPLSEQGKHTWVYVASTLPAETRVLRHVGGKNQLDALRRSVENRFMHDPKLLPVWTPGDTIDQSSMCTYSDPKSNQVLLVYAPISANNERLHFEVMSFQM